MQNRILTALPIDATTGQAYLGPQIDQVNIVLQPSLAGTGILELTLAVGGLAANSVYVAVK